MALLASSGAFGWWLIRLDTVSPRSGRPLSVPLVTARVEGKRYLVSMLGQHSKWVRNVRAADGHVSIRKGRRIPVVLREVPGPLRPPILQSYLRRAPGGRPHIPVAVDAPLEQFAAIAEDYPVFEIVVQRPGEPRFRTRDRDHQPHPHR